MIFRVIEPSPVLKSWVRNYLLVNLKDEFPAPTPYPARIEQALVFFSRGHIVSYDLSTHQPNRIAQSAIFGQQTSRLDFQSISEGDFLMMMVVFQPGGLYRFLGVPQYELCGEYCDAASFDSRELESINESLANESSYERMVQIVDNFMLKKLRSTKQDIHAVDKIGRLLLETVTPFSLDWLACQANLCPRQLERKFKERIGIGPKMFARINRFYHALSFKETHPDIDWLTVALQFGYNDYYHLSRDFKQFGNTTPNVVTTEFSEWKESFR